MCGDGDTYSRYSIMIEPLSQEQRRKTETGGGGYLWAGSCLFFLPLYKNNLTLGFKDAYFPFLDFITQTDLGFIKIH